MTKKKSPLRRRYLRELKHDPGKYIVVFLLMVISVGFVSGFLVADGSMIKAYQESFTKYKIEDGHFVTRDRLSDQQRAQIEALGITLADLPYINEAADNDSTLRIYPQRTQVDLISLMKGQMPEAGDEIALDRMYADNNRLKVGDTISFEDKDWTISALVAFSDYSTMFENNNDPMFDSMKFGVAAVTSEAFASLDVNRVQYCYAWSYEEAPANVQEEKERSDALMEQIAKIVTLKDFVPRYLNQAIQFTGEDMGSDKVSMEIFLYLIIVIIAFVFGVTMSNTIAKDSAVIGTLRATGCTVGELIRHYMTLPAIVTAVSALVGNILGYTLFRLVCVNMYYGSYSLPTYVTVWSGEAFLKTTLIPLGIMLVVNYLTLRRSLSLSPLKLLRRDLSRKKRSRALRLSHRIPFLRRFRLRVILRNLPGYLVLVAGVFFAYTLLLFGMMFPAVLRDYKDVVKDSMFSNYQYILTIPTEMLSGGNPLQNFLSAMSLKAMVSTENPDAEPFSAASLKTPERSGFRQEEIMLYGLSEDSRYIALDLKEDDVYISSGYADKYMLSVGDQFSLKEPYADTVYDFTVSGIFPYEGSLSVFMRREDLNQLMGMDEEFFAGYFSDTPIEDIDPRFIGSVIDEDALTRISRQLLISMGSIMYLLDAFSVILFLILIYLISKMIIDRNTVPISIVKILGSSGREAGKLYITPTTIVTFVSLIVTLPVVTWLIRLIFRVAMRLMLPGWMVISINPWIYVRMVLYGILAYGFTVLLERRRIRRIPMDETLKNVE